MATPTFRAIRRHLPRAEIMLVIRRAVAAVVHGAPWFDRTVSYAPEDGWAPREFLRCVGEVRRGRHELGVVLPNSFSSALMFYLGRVSRRIGYARDSRSALLTNAVPRPVESGRFKPTYMVDYYLALCEQLGIAAERRETELLFSDADAAHADRIMGAHGIEAGRPLFLIHAGAGFGPSKHWPPEHFSRLAEMLQERYAAQIALVGSPRDEQTAAAIIGRAHARIVDLSRSQIDLHLLKCVVSRSGLLVTTDSGPRHYGVALGVPTVCIMGPTHPGYSTSTRPHDHIVRVDVECGPCQRRMCPRDHRCMEYVTPEMAFEACERALSAEPEAPPR
jgi:heptosyltransferase-2